jgi:hypothetical protein
MKTFAKLVLVALIGLFLGCGGDRNKDAAKDKHGKEKPQPAK